MRILDHLVSALRRASSHNPESESAPDCILWPDETRQWEPLIPKLQSVMEELFVLGDYDKERRVGPAIWLRCVIAGALEGVTFLESACPILYLPGVGRHDLRAIESCTEYLKPLAETQYRATFWSQLNTKDWTILAYFKSKQGGLGCEVVQDNATKNALLLALPRLVEESIESLYESRIDAGFLTGLLAGDPIKEVLIWLDQGEQYQQSRSESEWYGFVEVCKGQLAFNPETEGNLSGAMHLASRKGAWQAVWERYCEAPARYTKIPDLLRKCQPDLFWGGFPESWPQWNDQQEKILRESLLKLLQNTPEQARELIQGLEEHHSNRRSSVWAELGEARLAMSLEYLAELAHLTKDPLGAGTLDDLAERYAAFGWRADDAVVRSLAAVHDQVELDAVTVAIDAIYIPWAQAAARYLQKVASEQGYPNASVGRVKKYEEGDCILFVDGLRFDVAKRVIAAFEERGLTYFESLEWAALPSVTATAKPAVAPVRELFTGAEGTSDFEPQMRDSGKSLKGGYQLKKALREGGWTVLDKKNTGDGKGRAWSEYSEIDTEGHHAGWRVGKQLDRFVNEIVDWCSSLLVAGWKRVYIVTDHGWLLAPKGLPKIDLPKALAANKWGRCASLKPGAHTEARRFAWYWNQNEYFVLANGIHCFTQGQEFAHGGLSLQECLTLHCTVSASQHSVIGEAVKITDVVWKGLRCTVVIEGPHKGISVDIRLFGADRESSVVVNQKPFKKNGTSSVVVEDEDLEGREAVVVLVDQEGNTVTQIATVIGEGA